ncbi:MAG TPA: hypothetical protein G4N93_03970 [Dehalococcoidia bacterium]|nr:hypothetical protein [Dehalococcoidia bacterium]
MSMVIPERTERKYEPYTEYKYSGVEWMGEIPAHWEVKKLKYSSSIVLGKMLESNDNGNYNEKPYLRAQNISWEKVDDSDIKEMWFSDRELIRYRLELNDLLVSEGGEVGRTAIWRNELEECYIQNSVHKVTIQKNNVPLYFLYQFLACGKSGHFEAIANRVSIAHLTREKLKEVISLIPPIQEQQAIADFLDRETARIDELIAKKQRLIDLLREQRTALITHAVTRGLTPYSPMKDSGVEWLGEIPAHWEIKSVKRISKVFNGSTPKSSEPEYWDGDIPWVTPEDLGELASSEISGTKRYITQAGYESCGTNLVPTGSLILSTRAPIGHLAIAATALCTNQGCRSLVPHSDMRTRFLYYVLYASRQELISLGQGSTFMELGKSKLETVGLPLPRTEEQQAIADHLDRETARIDNLIGKINQAIEKLQEYRSALITAAVTGKIDVRQHVS